MSDVPTRLKDARFAAGYQTARSAAEAMGLSESTYIQHENGTRGVPAGTIARYARFFKVTPEFLLYGRQTQVLTGASSLGPQIPLAGKVAAGVWDEALIFDDPDLPTFTGRPDITVPMKDRFGLRVEGQSMNQVFPPGTILECVTYWGDEPIANGRPVIVQRESDNGTFETTVKEYFVDDNGVQWLVPRSDNPAFQAPIDCREPGAGIKEIKIIALVVADTRLWG